MPKRSKSSARWLTEHANDEFVKRAQKEGWRSRAVFKLAQIQEAERAPNMAGIDAIDQPRSMYLAELALEFADRVLAPGGDLLLKLFQGAGFDQIIRDARSRYGRVVTKKPKASRTRSPEIYLLARQFGMV
jgi:23S rRNA U2552 (ribose-2'-O)-methylase RlmE/FtsJ